MTASAAVGTLTLALSLAFSHGSTPRVTSEGVIAAPTTTTPAKIADKAASTPGIWNSVVSSGRLGDIGDADQGQPAELSIPSIGVNSGIVAVGVVPGTDAVEVPPITEVGWYRFGAVPGDPGGSVLVGHVDGNGHTGIFWNLRQLQPGDEVTVGFDNGMSRSFVVTARAEVAKPALPSDLFSRQGTSRLTLITCGGGFDETTHHYLDNVIVVAVPQPS
jgi:LPXTG-site transpeptidase (sortase) family protein